MKQLLEAGVHFGHQTKRWNPKMRPYVYAARKGIYIIDLQKTSNLLDRAYDFVVDLGKQNKSILFVCTKHQGAQTIEEEAKRCGAFYINKRWIGGLLTNFSTISGRIKKLQELEEMEKSGEIDKLPVKEANNTKKELERLRKYFGGIKDMKKIPDALYIVDPKREYNAVYEAHILNIPIVAIADTNCDPDDVDYIIPGNDDAIRAIKLITSKIADAYLEGKEGRSPMEEAEESVESVESSSQEEKVDTEEDADFDEEEKPEEINY
ncbi:MAG: 30S ribosomal protein S2 [Mesoaciditoga sp.]|uniref:30S ribosomal protein S2 n=1 Tax=Athalassotoga sp. TaxID=2022597 RepID=UPI000CBC2346|nr:MAG: 30S ribosomal protein S2 [Mesoaciditoga sp.]PMP79796.1 MAG: 30S ribosomal protein S2 [Mesoaciditoga sp.]HEU24074.1 30S ribosomal protein S2 [Mesoaciditoga lauensis]